MDAVVETIKSIAKKYPCIYKLVLFGSRARGDYTEHSDYDIAVFGADKVTEALFADETGWIMLLNDRNATSHIYDEEQADEVFERIQNEYVTLFGNLLSEMERRA